MRKMDRMINLSDIRQEHLDAGIAELEPYGLWKPVIEILDREGYVFVGDLTSKSKADLAALYGMGIGRVNNLIESLMFFLEDKIDASGTNN